MKDKIIVASEGELKALIKECLESLQLTETPKEFLTAEEAKNLLQCGNTSLWKLYTEGKISITRTGKRNGLLYRRSSILAYLESKTEHAFNQSKNQLS